MTLALLGYGLAALSFTLLALLCIASWRGRAAGALLAAACAVTAAWAVLLVAWASGRNVSQSAVYAAEMVRDGAWLAFLARLLPGEGLRSVGGLARAGVWIGLAVALAMSFFLPPSPEASVVLINTGLGAAIFGLVLLEQVWRNTRHEQRYAMKFLVIGVGALFVYDLFLWSHGLLFQGVSGELWGVRGYANAMVVPVLVIAARRNPGLAIDVFVSRQVTFYTATLMGAGAYMLAMAAAGYGIRLWGGTWSTALQLIFFFAALLLLAVILGSEVLRSRLKVFIAKHFYANRYDYREEWLKLAATLGEEGEPLPRRALRGLARIVEARGGSLWLKRERSGPAPYWEKLADWQHGGGPGRLADDDALVAFMRRKRWSVHSPGVATDPEDYEGLELPDWLASFGPRALAVPLIVGGEMLGLAVLRDPRPGLSLDYEDIDLLRIAGGQAMTALAQDEAHRQLTESRQFEAYNRLTAFLMHDLKNLIAQQSLVVRNAGRFRGDPAFIDDAIDTIDNSVQRMQRLLEQLRQGSERERRESVSLTRLVEGVVASHADGAPAPVLRVASPAMKVQADPDRLAMIVGHVIRNAQDATPADGSITVTLDEADGFACIVVADTGTGMDAGFVAERLFRPFDSTKGAKGMGIGAYQVRQFAEEAGGGASVDSAPGQGTRFEIRLPLAAAAKPPAETAAAAAPREDVLTEKEQPASG